MPLPHTWLLAALLLLAVSAAPHTKAQDQDTADAPQTLRIMSFNIRYANRGDGQNRWENRRERLAASVLVSRPDIVGFQEALAPQTHYLARQLEDYQHVGVGRDDGKERGEMVPIFFRKDRFKLIDVSHTWLSPTPDTPGSIAWGANIPRMVTRIHLEDRKTGQTLAVYNTHFDHQSEHARQESAKLIKTLIAKSLAENTPVILTGDFNCYENSPAIQTLTQPDADAQFPGLTDTYRAIHPERKNNEASFNGWSAPATGSRIDFIFTSPNLTPQEATIHREHEGDRYPSDHYAVTAEVGYAEK